jgi:hypothetical protein
VLIFKLDKRNLRAQRVMDPRNPRQPLALSEMAGESCFSYTNPNILYGHSDKGHKILAYDFAKNAYRELIDLDKAIGGNAVRVGMVSPSRTGVLAANFGGPRQDEDPYEVVFDTKTKTSHILDTADSTLDDKPLKITLGRKMHNSHIDLSGRYVVCTFAGNGPINVAVWDTMAGEVYPANVFSDHRTNGFGMALSNAGLAMLTREGVSSAKPFNADLGRTAIVQGHDRHWSWNNETEGAMLPVFVSNYAMAGGNPRNGLLLGEIDAVATDGSNVIYRFAHHRSTYRGGFWDSPRGNVSPDGRHFMFTSNWEETVGKGRRDVFIVELTRKPTAKHQAATREAGL